MEISGYKLSREVGAGRVCTNYNALDVKHSKTVIVKVFNESLSKSQKFQNHFREVTGRLVNKELGNNIHYLDAIINSDTCALVTNYCTSSAGRQRKLSVYSEKKTIEIGKQLSASLSQLHNLGVVHGGVELANINFPDNSQVVLGAVAMHRTIPGIDVSKLVLNNSQELSYLAPEAEYGLTASSDFYSLGVVLYELLTGRKPFNVDSITEMEQQKKNGKYLPLNEELLHLTPLFEGLFSPDPELRISSDAQFNSILGVCRKDHAEISLYSNQNLPATEEASVASQPGNLLSISKTEKRSVFFAAAALLLAAVAILFVIISGKKEEPQQAVNEDQSQTASSQPKSIIRAPAIPEQSRIESEENGFYANATALVQEGDYNAALKAIDHALATEKDKSRAEMLKNEIVRELKIRSLVVIAKQQYDDEKYIMPAGDNAFETYQRIANLAVEDDERSIAGIQRIADHYLMLAKQQIKNKNMDDARKSIAEGLTLKPDYRPLLELKSSLAEAVPVTAAESAQSNLAQLEPPSTSTVQAATNQQGKMSSNNEKASPEAVAKAEDTKRLLQQQQRAREEKARALKTERRAEKRRAEERRAEQWQMEQERAAELAAQQKRERERIARQQEAERQAAKQRELAARETEIVRRLSIAEQKLATSPLSLLALDNAENEYRSLVKIAENDSRVTGLYRKIVNSHIKMANRQKKAAQFSDAMQTVNRGLALNQSNQQLNSLKSEITTAIEKAEKKQKEIPVIGTF